MQNIAGVVSFSATTSPNRTGEQNRTRARNYITNFLTTWNNQHPVPERITLVSMADTLVTDEDDNGDPTGMILPALDFYMTTPSEATATELHRLIHADTTANAYNDILGLSVWYSE
jgi:hypothetical protein